MLEARVAAGSAMDLSCPAAQEYEMAMMTGSQLRSRADQMPMDVTAPPGLEDLVSPLWSHYLHRAADIVRPRVAESAKAVLSTADHLSIAEIEEVLLGAATELPISEHAEHRQLVAFLRAIGLDWVVEEEIEGVAAFVAVTSREEWRNI